MSVEGDLIRFFAGRTDTFAEKGDHGYFRVQGALTEETVRAHLERRITIAPYMLDKDGRTGYLALDFDDSTGLAQARRFARQLLVEGLHTLVEESRGGRAHVFMLFTERVPWQDACWWGRSLRLYYRLSAAEVFPAKSGKFGPTVR